MKRTIRQASAAVVLTITILMGPARAQEAGDAAPASEVDDPKARVPGGVVGGVVVSGARPWEPILLRDAVVGELARDGISLARLGLSLRVEELTPTSVRVGLSEHDGTLVVAREIAELPPGLDAAIAQVTVVVAALVTEAEDNRKPVVIAAGSLPRPAAKETRDVAPRDHLAPQRSSLGQVRLWIVSDDRRVQLRRQAASVHSGAGRLHLHEIVCRTPCGATVDGSLGDRFYFSADGKPHSGAFDLIDHHGDVPAHVSPGSNGRILGGILLQTFGGSAAVASLAAVTVGPEDVRGPAVVGLAAGVVSALAGYWIYRSGKTRFELSPGRPD